MNDQNSMPVRILHFGGLGWGRLVSAYVIGAAKSAAVTQAQVIHVRAM
jgi:hypothetical protein